jgi:hypothetical protein
MSSIRGTSCCGIDEIANISVGSIKRTIEIVAHKLFVEKDRAAFYFFSDIGEQKYGKALTTYIIKHNLGIVQYTIPKRNPNSPNKLVVYTWIVAPNNFRKWYKKNKII